jgi:hypothetical protein
MTDPLPRLRALCTALPEVTEKLSHGSPTWFVRKVFVTYVGHHHGDPRNGFWCAAPPGAQEALVAARPQVYFRPPYVGHRGWLGVSLDALATGELDWDELAEVVTDAYREIAPKRLLAHLDET